MLSASLGVARRKIRQPAVNGVPIRGQCYARVLELLANIDRSALAALLSVGYVPDGVELHSARCNSEESPPIKENHADDIQQCGRQSLH